MAKRSRARSNVAQRRGGLGVAWTSVALIAWACGGMTEASTTRGAGGTAALDAAASGGASGFDASGVGGTHTVDASLPDANAGGTPEASTDAAEEDVAWLSVGGCSATPPVGAPMAPSPPAYNGTCPTLPTTTGTVQIQSSGNTRSFIVAVPDNLQPNEQLPIVFLWHWLGGSASDFFDQGDVQNAVDQQRFLAVIPQAKGDLTFTWPYSYFDTTERQQEEFQFFDDMLSCVEQQYDVNKECVASVGVSAGALWTDQLVGARSQYLSSFESLSGGVGPPPAGSTIKPWVEPKHPIPGIVLWGGPNDVCVLQHFQDLSQNLEAALKKDGSFFVECIHNCGHAEPPFEPPDGYSTYAGLWQFVLDHPYWLPKGYSPYIQDGLPISDPAWCGIGANSATPRTGSCPPPACNF
jgi:predicted esterase